MSNIAVVTGAGRGLGRAIAQRLAARNLRVLVTDIDGDAAARVAAELGGGCWAMPQDVRDPESHRMVARAATVKGDVSIWINNAGVLDVGPTWDMEDEVVRRMIDINFSGLVWGCHAAVPVLVEGGQIINISSMSGLTPTPGLAVYGATKHAVVGFSLSLASELRQAGRHIDVSVLCPDAIQGDMTNAVADDDASGLLFSAGRLLTMEQVADAAVELLDKPKLVKVLPAYRAAVIHALRPFPRVVLPLLEQVAKLGRWRVKR